MKHIKEKSKSSNQTEKRGTLYVSNYYKWMLKRDGKRLASFSKYLCDKQSPLDIFYPLLAQWDSVQASHQSASRSSLGGEHEVLQTVQQMQLEVEVWTNWTHKCLHLLRVVGLFWNLEPLGTSQSRD